MRTRLGVLVASSCLLLLASSRGWWATSEAQAAADTTTTRTSLRTIGAEHAIAPLLLPSEFRPAARRLGFAPGAGRLGRAELYTLRVSYSAGPRLGFEVSLGHTPGQVAHAAFHMLSAQLRPPLNGRVQPYATAGYGMAMVFPGRALNAPPVTRNALGLGGGLELYLRPDVAVRGEGRWIAVLGTERERSGTVRFDYREATLGFSFSRPLGS